MYINIHGLGLASSGLGLESQVLGLGLDVAGLVNITERTESLLIRITVMSDLPRLKAAGSGSAANNNFPSFSKLRLRARL
jgi:hypothetical protein